MARIWSVRRVTRRGVSARDTMARRLVCAGGSRKIIIPVSARSGPMRSSTVPRAELNTAVSRCAASMSAKRLRAQKSY